MGRDQATLPATAGRGWNSTSKRMPPGSSKPSWNRNHRPAASPPSIAPEVTGPRSSPLRGLTEWMLETQVKEHSPFTCARTDSDWHGHSSDDLQTALEVVSPANARAHVRQSRPFGLAGSHR